MPTIGLTGGIGSGKSTAAAMLADHGATVVDADALVHQLQAPGEAAYSQIIDRFGSGVARRDGTIDRPKLAGLVFSSREALDDLERIVTPLVQAEIQRNLTARAGLFGRVIVLEIPLLASHHREDFHLDAVVVVDCPAEVALERLVGHRRMDRSDALARIGQQPSREARAGLADFVLDNTGSLEDLAVRVGQLWSWLQGLGSRG